MARISNVYCHQAMDECYGYETYRSIFKDVVEKDSPGKTFGFDTRSLDMLCIDMDKVEVDHTGDNARTMDLVLGLSDFDDVKQSQTRRYLLPVELKLNCVAFNLGTSELLEKDEHTRSYHLGVDYCPNSVFLFTESVIAHATSNISRWKRGTNARRMKNWNVMTPKSFSSFIKYESDFPYIPQTDMEVVKERILALIEKGNIDECAAYIQGTLKVKIEDYYKAYNMLEINFVANKLKEILENIPANLSMEKIDKDYLDLAASAIYGLAN